MKPLKQSEEVAHLTLVQWLREVRAALRAAGSKRELPGRTSARVRARAHLRRSARWVTSALRALDGRAG